MNWTTNPIMEWSKDNGTTWEKVSDHGRSPLAVSVERIENKQRMANGTLRRYTVAKKRTWTASWENLPDKPVPFLANGKAGQWMEQFHKDVDGVFKMRLRAGSEQDTDGSAGEVVNVMIIEYSRETTRRTKAFDFWAVDITLEEV